MRNILHISPDFNYSCGISKLVYLTLSYFDNNSTIKNHFITNGGDSLERLERIKNINFKQIKFDRGLKNVFYYNKFYNAVKDYCIENKIDIIHSYHRFPELISNKISLNLKLKTVTSALSFVRNYEKMSFKADKIICEIDYIKNMLVENFKVSPDKIEKMYLPAESFKTLNDQEKKNLLSFYRIKENKKILLFVGKISLVKGCDTLLKAFDIVRNKYNDAVLIMCGKIFDKSFAKHINSKDNSIIYIKPYIDYFKLYQLAEMVILPSRVEPFPFVMVESGSNKKAFVGGNTGGMKEFINNGKDGFLIDPENHSELAEKIIYLLNNKHATEQLGENLFKKVKEKCDYNKYFCKVDEIYNSLLDQ